MLLSAGELPLSSSLSLPLQSLFPPRNHFSFSLSYSFSLSNLFLGTPFSLCRAPSLYHPLFPSFFTIPCPSDSLSSSPSLSLTRDLVRFLALPSRRGENKNYESARHLSRATARSRGFVRPYSATPTSHVSTEKSRRNLQPFSFFFLFFYLVRSTYATG